MFWLYVHLTQIVLIVAILIYQYHATFKVYTLDKVLFNFREMRFQATLLLTDNLRGANSDPEENEELRGFITLTTNTVDNFDQLKSTLFKFKGFLRLFSKIDTSFQGIEKTNLEKKQQTYHFKEEFIDNLYLAFNTVPFFRFRIILFIVSALVRLLSIASFTKASVGVQQFNRMLDLYSLIKKERQIAGLHNLYSTN